MKLPITIVLATAMSLIAATPVSANGPSLGGQSLSLDTGEVLLLRLDTDAIVEGDDASVVWCYRGRGGVLFDVIRPSS